MIKTQIKKINYLYNLILILLISGLSGSMLYFEWEIISPWWRIALLIIALSYPIFTIYQFLLYPHIELHSTYIVMKSKLHSLKIDLDNIYRVDAFVFSNLAYRMGTYYAIYAADGTRMNIPRNFYSNEDDLWRALELKISPYKIYR